MSDIYYQMVDDLYGLIKMLPLCNYQTPRNQLPQNGIYFFFEQGEYVQWQSMVMNRIVRVGTHKKDGRFRARIRQHYGNVKSLMGNKNGSVFRKHVGGALLKKANAHDPRLNNWLTQDRPSFADVEELVSRILRENFTFCCFCVNQGEERMALERGLIALLAQYPLGEPSLNWLGKGYAANEKIRRSGLWNTQHIDAQPLTVEKFRRLKILLKATLVDRIV